MNHLLLYEVTWDMRNMMECAQYNHHHHPSGFGLLLLNPGIPPERQGKCYTNWDCNNLNPPNDVYIYIFIYTCIYIYILYLYSQLIPLKFL